MSFSFDNLAQETFELSEKFGHKTASSPTVDFDSIRELSVDNLKEQFFPQEWEVLNKITPGPGLIFWITKSLGTYCLRGISSEDVKDHYKKFLEKDPYLLKQLKIKELDFENEIIPYTFNTSRKEEADYISQNLLNKRIPLHEDWLTNISDPGIHWWLTDKKNKIEIQFGNRGIYSKDNCLELGPIGNARNFSNILNNCYEKLNDYIPLSEFSCDSRSLNLTPLDPLNKNFKKLINLIVHGEMDFVYSENELFKQLNLIGWSRRFWIYTSKFLYS